MNINILEKEMLKAIGVEKEGVEKESSFDTLETVEMRFSNLERFLKKLCREYRGQS
jgi:hypothetical protein